MALTEERKAQLQQQIDELDEAIASGALRIRYRDRDVTFRSEEKMKALLNEKRRELAGLSPTRRARTFTVYSKKGV